MQYQCTCSAVASKGKLCECSTNTVNSQHLLSNSQCCESSDTYLWVGTDQFSCSRWCLSTEHQLPPAGAACSSHYFLLLLKHYLLPTFPCVENYKKCLLRCIWLFVCLCHDLPNPLRAMHFSRIAVFFFLLCTACVTCWNEDNLLMMLLQIC